MDNQDQMKEEKTLKNGIIGKFNGYRLNGKTYTHDGKEIEEVHEVDCFCCSKDLFTSLLKEVIKQGREEGLKSKRK